MLITYVVLVMATKDFIIVPTVPPVPFSRAFPSGSSGGFTDLQRQDCEKIRDLSCLYNFHDLDIMVSEIPIIEVSISVG